MNGRVLVVVANPQLKAVEVEFAVNPDGTWSVECPSLDLQMSSDGDAGQNPATFLAALAETVKREN